MLNFLYNTVMGRLLLKPLTHPGLSKLCGKFLDSGASRFLIPGFIKRNNIDMTEAAECEYDSFNSFFCRRLVHGARPVDMDEGAFISPCDGLLSAYKIDDGLVIPVKGSRYSIADLVKDAALAEEFDGGDCLVFRLCVNHYHRYAYVESGIKTDNVFIPGLLHTVRPVALRQVPVFTQNAREYTLIHTKTIGDVLQMEVGALLVGKIKNLMEAGPVKRGDEKGHFLYGGSTIIVLTQNGAVKLPDKLFSDTEKGVETPVKLGQKISE